jgi:large subunit ribosomal protein L29
MASTSFKEMTAQELVAKGRELRLELFNLRLQKATARLEKPHRIQEIRRDIARCETRLSSLRTQTEGTKA